MAFDSAADLLFNIGANSDDAEANIARFRSLLGTDLDAMGAQFSDWADKVFGDLSTVEGALIGITAGLGALGVAATAFGVSAANKFEEYAIAVGDAAQKTGLTTQTLSAMHLAAHELNVSFDQVTTGLVRFERSVFAAQDPTSKQAQLLERMGFTTDQVKGAMQNIDPFLDEFGKRFATLHEGPEKTGVAMEFMGRAGANNIKFMQVWAAQAEELRKETRALGMELSPALVDAARRQMGATKELEEQWDAFVLRIGQRVLPMLTKAEISFGGLGEVLDEIGKGHFYGWAAAWMKGAEEMSDSIDKMAEAQRAAKVLEELFNKQPKPKAAKEAAEDIHTLTDRLEEMKVKLADLEGPEAKLTEELTQMLLKAGEAATALGKANAEHKLAPGVYDREAGALAELIAMIARYQGVMEKSFGDKDLAELQKYVDGLAAAKRSLEEKIEGAEGSGSFERQKARLAQEVEAERQKYAEEGKLDAEMEALLVRQKAEGLARIDAEQKQAYDRELAAFQDHLTKMLEADMTEEQKLTAQHKVETDKLIAESARAMAGATPGQAQNIQEQSLGAQLALLDQYQNKLNALHNSEGWQGVFGDKFASMIKGNEDLSRQWAERGSQDNLMMQVAMESLDEMGQKAFGDMAQGMTAGILHAIEYGKSIGQAMRQATAAVIDSLAEQAAEYAIYSLAQGFMDLSNPETAGLAPAAFEAAALFGAGG